jgi:hypothetical protein
MSMILTHTLTARTARARSHYLGELVDVLRCAILEGGQPEEGPLRCLAEEAAQIACRLAFDARILWNAAQERMRATGKDDLPLREYVRGVLAGARSLAEDALKTTDSSTDTFRRLRQEADRLRQELLATELPWDESNSLRVDPKAFAQAQADTARGDVIDMEEWLRELQASGDASGQ